jgi:BirA family transcriptional regulator, biotin operon repressor / biotin---[acetyl-CoA-carboxylase] ligase
MPLPSLPPAFHLVALDREVGAFERAVRAAPRGVDDGTLYWTERTDCLDLAFVVEPEAPAATTLQALYVLTVATGDALDSLLPPVAPVEYAWPGDLILAGAKLGQVRAAIASVVDPAEVPPWLVLGLTLSVGPLGDDPGLLPNRTSLHDAGSHDVAVVQLVEAVSSRLLYWTSRWQKEGLAPVRASWNPRCFRIGQESDLTLADQYVAGCILGLDADGAFSVGTARFRLADHLNMIR